MKIVIPFLVLVILLSSCRNSILEKNYELDYNPNHEINLITPANEYQSIKIPGHILFYGHNKDYIIIDQKPKTDIYKAVENLAHDEKMAEVLKTQFHQFWIIRLKDDRIYGPLNKQDYFLIRDRLGIPVKLKLDNSTLEFYTIGQGIDIEYSILDSETIDIENLKGNKSK